MKLFEPNPTPLNIISAELQRCTVTQPYPAQGMHWESNPMEKDDIATLSRSRWSKVNPVGGRATIYFITLMTN